MIFWIKEQFINKGYTFIDDKRAYQANVFAVRSKNSLAGMFDDLLYLVYRDDKLQWRIHQYKVTTDPGTYWLRNPMRVDGTAILVPGQYMNTYKIDTHRGRSTSQQALCQRLDTVKVYRDDNKDEVIDMSPEKKQEGMFGINIHSGRGMQNINEKWSAGCIVFAHEMEDFKPFMKILHRSAGIHGNVFNFTLFDEMDFDLNCES